jgi:hypothetical protein
VLSLLIVRVGFLLPVKTLPTSFSAKYLFRNVLVKDRMTGAKINATKPLILKPGTKIEANQKHSP